ncbi:lysozyme [Pseudomonas fluorescens]|uniref:lysozyme n=1 Tax=Pseudomonas fluorescens TaxID=294 RepID=UPI00069926CE|nr:lysozyme [Pseudomonas fluorescens]
MGIYVPRQAVELASRPEFDGLHDPDRRTSLIEPYHDPVGLPTIGYGHLLSRKSWEDLSRFPAITAEQARALLVSDLAKAAASVNRLITVRLSDSQLSALIDFCFNCGAGNLEISTLRRVINRGELADAPEQFMRWVHAKGVKLPGLVKRRRAEVELWLA